MNAGFIAQLDSSTMTVKLASLVLGGIGQYPVSTFYKWLILKMDTYNVHSVLTRRDLFVDYFLKKFLLCQLSSLASSG